MTKAGKTTRLALTLAAAMLALPAVANADKGKARPTLVAKADTRGAKAKTRTRSAKAAKKAPAKAPAASDDWLEGLYGDTKVVQVQTAAPAPTSRQKRKAKKDAPGGLESLSEYAKGSASGFALRGRLRGAPEYEEIEKFEAQSLDQRAIGKVIERNRDKIHYCYTKVAGRGQAAKALNGEVNVHFVVEPQGKVTKVEVFASKSKKGKQLGRCMTRFIKRWKFPAADAQTVVDYPFVFDVGGSTLSEE
jgi:TonB family protein